jgi:methionyl-tRNA formyltransferase
VTAAPIPARVALVGNHWTALVAARALLTENALVAAATPRLAHDANERVAAVVRAEGLPYAAFDHHDVGDEIGRLVATSRPDVVFVVGCPYRIPADSLAAPRHGFWNFHFGLLPRDRGPDPVFWQIRNREPRGGITCHRMDERFDHGPVIETRAVAIDPADTYGLHVNRLAVMLGDMVRDLARRAASSAEAITTAVQDPVSGAPRSRPALGDLAIDWREEARSIAALVRAANPIYGGAVTLLRGVPIRVLEATALTNQPVCGSSSATPSAAGTLLASDAREIAVACGAGTALRLDVVACEEGVMSAPRFAAAYRLTSGERCGAAAA